MVYGHLHIPRTTWYDGVRFEEVSVGYPREWRRRKPYRWMRQILPDPNYPPGYLNEFGPGNAEPLEPGMAFSVEPGIYPGPHGARIEDIVVCTEQGYERLNHVTRELVVVGGG